MPVPPSLINLMFLQPRWLELLALIGPSRLNFLKKALKREKSVETSQRESIS